MYDSMLIFFISDLIFFLIKK